ncbi:MAG: hypothetical protein FJY55_12285 [Betaproteobacteria bacterium]|nr:hypothetical protein [Betaproteobacteria bacterium]
MAIAWQPFQRRRLEIAPEQLLRLMGYRDAATIRPQVRETAAAMAQLAESAATPAASYRRVPIASCSAQELVLSTGTRFGGSALHDLLSDCEAVVVFVLSLGARFDGVQRNLAAGGKTLEAYMMEMAGWIAIEQATRLLRQHLQAEAKGEALRLTRRMAPGYTTRADGIKVEWPLEDQRPLFKLFGEDAPARLVEGSCAMTPKMSRSGLFGLAPAAATRAAPAQTPCPRNITRNPGEMAR